MNSAHCLLDGALRPYYRYQMELAFADIERIWQRYYYPMTIVVVFELPLLRYTTIIWS